MDDAASLKSASETENNQHWQAELNLQFDYEQGRSYLAKKLHFGPLVLQKTLHPEGLAVCHGVIVHPPGGVAGGDALTLNVEAKQDAHALLTTPGAGKWYKANGHVASQHLAFNIENAGCVEWLPQENILFDGAQVKLTAEVNLHAQASYAAWEILCFGRQAQGEVWQTGSLQQCLMIKRDGRLLWQENTLLRPTQRTLNSIAGLNGNAVSASFVIAAGAVPVEVLENCRAIAPDLTLDAQAKFGVTALPEIFSARYVGQSAPSARHYFEQLWTILRPWYAGKTVIRPRIWNT